jgi:hypothetical protein
MTGASFNGGNRQRRQTFEKRFDGALADLDNHQLLSGTADHATHHSLTGG